MSHTITYSLKPGSADSDAFYSALAVFADAWLAETFVRISPLKAGFNEERIRRGARERSSAACAFDLLALGVQLRQHTLEPKKLAGWGEFLLNTLLKLQERWPKGEGLIKMGRGLVYRLARLLNGKSGRESSLDTLLVWLRATGEDTQVERFSEWRDYLRGHNLEQDAIDCCRCLADDFEISSLRTLGKYTEGVETFLDTEARRHRWRYDASLLGRTRLEYHLGMIGNEILNREFRMAFLGKPRKVVILPPCMRAQAESKCKAVMTKFGARCAACTPTCRIHQVTKLGEKRGFEVFMIPEELRIFSRAGSDDGVGVVGVSCVLTNWSGGWDAESIGLPAQGLLLDYVGCKYHWDTKGFPTDINLHKLLQILAME